MEVSCFSVIARLISVFTLYILWYIVLFLMIVFPSTIVPSNPRYVVSYGCFFTSSGLPFFLSDISYQKSFINAKLSEGEFLYIILRIVDFQNYNHPMKISATSSSDSTNQSTISSRFTLGNRTILSCSSSVHGKKYTSPLVKHDSFSFRRVTLSFVVVMISTAIPSSWSCLPMISPPLLFSIRILLTQNVLYTCFINGLYTFSCFCVASSS